MIDFFGRTIDYARISITDRCNLNCIYCMPKDKKINFLENNKIMSVSDIYTISKLLSNIGISKIKITGGEPLVRDDIKDIIKRINSIENIKNITITTNGVLLHKYIDFLYSNSVKDINISLDSLNPQKYNDITNFKLNKILDTISSLKFYKDLNIKINVVPINLQNDDIVELVEFSQVNNIKLRFIELMPIGCGNKFEFISNERIIHILNNIYGNSLLSNKIHGNGPAKYFSFDKLNTDIGFISAMSHNFCNTCNRVRITCDGKLKPCINFNDTLDIKNMIADKIDYNIIENKILESIYNKPKKHSFLINVENTDNRKMYQIGG